MTSQLLFRDTGSRCHQLVTDRTRAWARGKRHAEYLFGCELQTVRKQHGWQVSRSLSNRGRCSIVGGQIVSRLRLRGDGGRWLLFRDVVLSLILDNAFRGRIKALGDRATHEAMEKPHARSGCCAFPATAVVLDGGDGGDGGELANGMAAARTRRRRQSRGWISCAVDSANICAKRPGAKQEGGADQERGGGDTRNNPPAPHPLPLREKRALRIVGPHDGFAGL